MHKTAKQIAAANSSPTPTTKPLSPVVQHPVLYSIHSPVNPKQSLLTIHENKTDEFVRSTAYNMEQDLERSTLGEVAPL